MNTTQYLPDMKCVDVGSPMQRRPCASRSKWWRRSVAASRPREPISLSSRSTTTRSTRCVGSRLTLRLSGERARPPERSTSGVNIDFEWPLGDRAEDVRQHAALSCASADVLEELGLVKYARRARSVAADARRLLLLANREDLEPEGEAVNGALVLDDLAGFVRRFVVITRRAGGRGRALDRAHPRDRRGRHDARTSR